MTRQTPASNPVHETHRPPAEWSEHEHVNPATQADAERLLESAGAPEIAKHAIDLAQQHSAPDATTHFEFAVRAGFPSYLELVSASTRIDNGSDPGWLISPLATGQWMAWTEQELRGSTWDTRQAAEDWVRRGAPQSSPARRPSGF